MSRLMSALSSSSLASRSSSSTTSESSPVSYSRSSSPDSSSSDSVRSLESLSKKHDTSMPLSSTLAASLPPTISFDDDPSWIPHPADPWSLKHSEFGHCDNQSYRATSIHSPGMSLKPDTEEPSYFVFLATYYSYIFLIIVGHMRDFVGKKFYPKEYQHLSAHDVSSIF